MDAGEFSVRYPHRLKLLAERAIYTVADGVPCVNTKLNGRGLRLRAFLQTTDERGTKVDVVRVAIEGRQTNASLCAILLAMVEYEKLHGPFNPKPGARRKVPFDMRGAKLIRVQWSGALYADPVVVRPREYSTLSAV